MAIVLLVNCNDFRFLFSILVKGDKYLFVEEICHYNDLFVYYKYYK